MKKILLIIAALLITALLSCSSSHKNAGSSLVTITVGSDKTASLSIQQATLYAKLKNFLAKHLQVPSAMASIPANVASIQIMVWASDMPAITQTVDTTGLASVSVTIEVPNGFNRLFAITGFDSSGNITYGGGMPADLNGSEVFLPVPMINLGSVPLIFYVSTSGNDATGDGTLQKPFRTITAALALAVVFKGNVGILVWPGTYNTNTTGGENFPLTLPLNTALACIGEKNSVVISDAGASAAAGALIIAGAAGARIDSCKIHVSEVFSTAIDDGGFALTVNNSSVNGIPGGFFFPTTGIQLSANSTVTNSTITGFPGSDGNGSGIWVSQNAVISNNTCNGNYYGVYVFAGSPVISNSLFTNNNYGVYINNGSPTITLNTIKNNSFGGIQSTSGATTLSPVISNNVISNDNTGIGVYYAGAWDISGNTISNNLSVGIEIYGLSNITGTVAGNTIKNNVIGIDVSGSSVIFPSISTNSLTCNTTADLNTSVTSTVDASSNAWDHDPPTTYPVGAAACAPGGDICFSGLQPIFLSNTVVPSPCLP